MHSINTSYHFTFTDTKIVHGMLVASIFSSVIGTLIPGVIYRSQSLTFHSSVYVNEIIIGRVEVMKLRVMKKDHEERIAMTCKTTVRKESDDILCVSGQATVLLPHTSYIKN